MPTCVALGCSNRHENGHRMKRFPKDPVRTKKWIAMVNRTNWTPTKNSYLCDAHFAPNMWEKPREDGKQKLKVHAIPTLFPELKKRQISPPVTETTIIDSDYSNNAMKPEPMFDFTLENTEQIEINVDPLLYMPDNLNCNNSEIKIEKNELNKTELQLKLLQYEKQYRKSVKINIKLKNRLRKTKHALKRQQNADGLENKLAKFFNPDQIQCLKRNSTRFLKWSNETLENAYKLRTSCGIKGYKELLRQKFPLPSLRTLRRYRSPENIQMNTENSNVNIPSVLVNEIPEYTKSVAESIQKMPDNIVLQNSQIKDEVYDHILDHNYTILVAIGPNETVK